MPEIEVQSYLARLNNKFAKNDSLPYVHESNLIGSQKQISSRKNSKQHKRSSMDAESDTIQNLDIWEAS